MSRYKLGYVAPLKKCPESGSVGAYWDRSKELKYSASYVRSKLYYNPDTGEFIRLQGLDKGKRAGFLNRNGYWSIKLDTVGLPAHRIAWVYMTGEWPDRQVDHINWDRSDNRWVNLRLATHGQNKSNGKRYKNNTTRLKGVSTIPSRPGKFRARIRKNGVEVSLGVWNSAEEAHEAYVVAAKKLHGDYWSAG